MMKQTVTITIESGLAGFLTITVAMDPPIKRGEPSDVELLAIEMLDVAVAHGATPMRVQ